MDRKDNKNNWSEYSFYVLNSLEEIKEVKKCLTGLKVELAVLKIKITLWGAIGGMIGTVVGTLLIQIVFGYFKTTGKTP